MAFDGITTKSISYELQHSILGGKINKILNPIRMKLYLVYMQTVKTMCLTCA